MALAAKVLTLPLAPNKDHAIANAEARGEVEIAPVRCQLLPVLQHNGAMSHPKQIAQIHAVGANQD